MIVSTVLVALVALAHLGFLVLEMFLWTKPFGRKTFGMSQELAESTAVLAKNQGLYNGFLAAGLIWGLVLTPPEFAHQVKVFFLACVLVAGVYGGFTASRAIFVVQALPALLALGAVLARW